MKKSEILQEAKWSIVLGETAYICDALRLGTGSREDVESLRAWVRELLHPWRAYEDWLRELHPEAYRWMRAQPGARCEARLQWLDWMIAYWREKGE